MKLIIHPLTMIISFWSFYLLICVIINSMRIHLLSELILLKLLYFLSDYRS